MGVVPKRVSHTRNQYIRIREQTNFREWLTGILDRLPDECEIRNEDRGTVYFPQYCIYNRW